MGRRAYFSACASDRVLAIVVLLTTFGGEWYRHASFRTGTYDLAVFEQVVWKMAHGHGATSSLTAWNTFGDHFSPALLLFVPLYRLAATPLWFFAAQSVTMAVGLLCVRPLVRAAGGDEHSRMATFLVVAYALSPALWNATLFDFHTSTLAVPFLMIGCIAALEQRNRDVWLVFFALVLLRDDLALAAVPLALVGWRSADRRAQRSRVALAFAGVAWTVIGSEIGTALGASRHFVARYGYLGDSMTAALTHPVHAAAGLTAHFFEPSNLVLAVALLVPLAFLPVGKPGWAAMAVFMALPVLVANDPFLHSPSFQYGAPIFPFLLLAAAGTLPKLKDDWYRRAALATAPLVALGFLASGPLMTQTLSLPTANASDARVAMRMIKPNDVVVASNEFASHVADRNELIPFPFPFLEASHEFPLDPRVTSTSEARRATVDVIIASRVTKGTGELIGQLLRDPDVTSQFTTTSVGDIVVLRRIGS